MSVRRTENRYSASDVKCLQWPIPSGRRHLCSVPPREGPKGAPCVLSCSMKGITRGTTSTTALCCPVATGGWKEFGGDTVPPLVTPFNVSTVVRQNCMSDGEVKRRSHRQQAESRLECCPLGFLLGTMTNSNASTPRIDSARTAERLYEELDDFVLGESASAFGQKVTSPDGAADDDESVASSQAESNRSEMLLASFNSVFTMFREMNPYLRSGFRRPNLSWSQALRSVTEVHNETANIWLHLVAGIWHTYLFFTEPYHPWMLTAIVCGAICFYLSAGYHTFRFMSRSIFAMWLRIDHFGCAVFIAGSNYTWLQIIYACQEDLRFFYSAAVIGAAALTLVVPMLPEDVRVVLANRLGYKLYDLAEPFLTLTAFASIAGVGHHLYLRGAGDEISRMVLTESFLYIVGFAIFLTKVPERIRPRDFDIWGNSHQLWHLFIALSDAYHIHCLRYYCWRWNPDC